MYKPTPDYEWSFAHCSNSLRWMGAGIYTDQCCISDGVHILTCKASTHGQRDWSRSILMMFGHTFCDDAVGQHAFITLNMSGAYVYKELCLLVIYKSYN